MTIRKMVLSEKLRTKLDIMTTYLIKITQVRDELVAVGEAVIDGEMVKTTLNGFTKP